MFRALERKEPDRVPHFEDMIDPKIMNRILPGASYEEFIEYMDWDALVHDDQCREEVLDESRRIVRNEWGAVMQYTHELSPILVEAPIKSEKDLESYQPPDPADFLAFLIHG
jgi:hypothetical protein